MKPERNEHTRLITLRVVVAVIVTVNLVYLSLGLSDSPVLERSVVIPVTVLQLVLALVFREKLQPLAKYSTLLCIIQLIFSVFILQHGNLGFHYYFLAIVPFLGFVDEFRNSYSRIFSFVCLVLYVVSLVWLAVGDILRGVVPVVAVVEYSNQILVGIILIAVFLLFFRFKSECLARVTRESLIDPLTKTFNRRALEADMKFVHSDKRGRDAYLVMMDIDDFKSINDRFGHQAGDFILAGVADITNCTVRSTDRLYRYGGEEFLLVMRDIDEASAIRVTEKIRANIELQYWEVLEGEIITCSFGVSPLDRQRSIEESISAVDRALYRAKSTGKNRIHL